MICIFDKYDPKLDPKLRRKELSTSTSGASGKEKEEGPILTSYSF